MVVMVYAGVLLDLGCEARRGLTTGLVLGLTVILGSMILTVMQSS